MLKLARLERKALAEIEQRELQQAIVPGMVRQAFQLLIGTEICSVLDNFLAKVGP